MIPDPMPVSGSENGSVAAAASTVIVTTAGLTCSAAAVMAELSVPVCGRGVTVAAGTGVGLAAATLPLGPRSWPEPSSAAYVSADPSTLPSKATMNTATTYVPERPRRWRRRSCPGSGSNQWGGLPCAQPGVAHWLRGSVGGLYEYGVWGGVDASGASLFGSLKLCSRLA